MWIRTLIGRNAGRIIDVPYATAEASIANGTAARLSSEELGELQDAGPRRNLSLAEPESPPEGYEVAIAEDGYGWVVRDRTGTQVGEVFPNAVAARGYAQRHSEVTIPPAQKHTRTSRKSEAAKAPEPASLDLDASEAA